jgi:hypothetical protein
VRTDAADGRTTLVVDPSTGEAYASGTRLFDGVDASRVALEPIRSESSSRVTHLTYAVRPR